MPITPGNIITVVVVLIVLAPLLAFLAAEWGEPSVATSFGNYSTFASNAFENKSSGIVTNINKTILNGTAYSNHLSNATAILGFALAFILPNFNLIVQQMIQLPNLIASFLSNVEVPVFNLALPQFGHTTNGLPTNFIQGVNNLVVDLLLLFSGFVALSMWFKYPSWSATG